MLRTGDMRSLAQIYRGTETAGSLRSVKTTWAAGATTWGGFLPAFLTMRSYGAGEVPAGLREFETHAGADVESRDGLEITAGPEAGSRWRVVAVDEATPGRAKLRLEPFEGAFA